MEGRGKSRRRNTRQEWKRRLSSALAVVLTAAMVLNMPLSIDSLGLHVSNAFASGSNADREGGLWATASNAKYQKGQSQDVDIYVIAEDNEAAPGNTSSMTLYLKNNTGQTITEGTLSFKGNHIAKEDGYFEDMGTAQADSPTVIVGGEDPTKQTEASGEGMLYQEDGEDSKESIDGEASLGDQDGIAGGDDADADANDVDDEDADDEDAEEEESHKLTDIDLQPGEMREIRFTYYTDDEENSTKAYVEFSFHGEDENEAAVRSSSKFYYSIGLPFVNFSMEDGMQIESGVSNDMEIWMSEPTWVDEALEERIEKQEEEEAEKAYRDEETGTADTASSSNADKASDSNASKDTEDADTQKDQDKINQYKEEAMTLSKVSYDVEIYGAELERFSPRKAEEVEDLGWISCIYEVANNTEPGVYYGKVTANGRWNNRKFTSEQGFLFEVTGEGKTGQEFTKELDKVIVHAYAEEGVLEEGVKLTAKELRQEDAETAEQFNEAKDALDAEGTEYDGMMALDISFVDKDGQEVEPNGDVQVSIEMKKDALPEDIDLETVEVHHMKEVDNTVEVEPVADGADKTDGTIKSAEAAVAELKEAEVSKEEIEAAVSDEAVAVAEFSVGSFSTFTITWTSGKTTYFEVTVHHVNENNEEVNPPSKDVEIKNGEKIEFETFSGADILGLEYKGAYYENLNGTKVSSVSAQTWWIPIFGQRWSLTFENDAGGKDIRITRSEDDKTKKVDIYMVYGSKESVDSPDVVPTKELSRTKKAVLDPDTGLYDLSLSVSGAVGSIDNKAKIDFLLIVDTSGSMANDMNGKEIDRWDNTTDSRMDVLEKAVAQLTETIEENKDKIDAQYSIVGFSSNKYTQTKLDWTDQVSKVKSTLNDITPTGGTNYQKGIEKGIEQLKSDKKRDGVETVVIFLSDGIPTFRGEDHNDAPWYDLGYGNGQSDPNGYNIAAAVTAIQGMGCNSFYAIGIGNDFENLNSQPVKNLENLCNNVGKNVQTPPSNSDWYTATDLTELQSIFEKIAAESITILSDHVKIEDTLTNEAKIVMDETGKPKKLTVTIKDVDGQIIDSIEENGMSSQLTLPETEMNGRATVEASYGNGKLELTFTPETYKLEAGWEYILTTQIDATEQAYERYRIEGYTDVPDKGTGTHAENSEKGFYSNDRATVTYQYNGETHKVPYDDPVIQIHPGQLVIEKKIVGLQDNGLSQLKQQLQFDVELTWKNDDGVDKNQTLSLALEKDFKLKDGTTDTYICTIDGLSPNTTYKVAEENYNVNGYTRKDSSTVATGTVAKGGIETTSFVNEYESMKIITVVKKVEGNMSESDQAFQFYYRINGGDIIKYSSPLGNNETFDISVPAGSTVDVWEDEAGYIPSYIVTKTSDGAQQSNGKENSCTLMVVDDDYTITFTNKKEIQTPTGVFTDNVPYLMLIAVAAFGAVGCLYPVARKKKLRR